MFADSPFAVPRSPFEAPVPIVDVDPDDGDLVSVRFNPAWSGHVLGALKSLVLQTTWDTQDPDVLWLAQKRAMLLLQLFVDYVPERPFWETPEEIDDEELPEEPWYDTISDWIITGFIASTFEPQAAIVYKATIPRLRLAFRSGNAGTFVKVLVNSAEIWTGDTSAPVTGLIEQILDVGAFSEAHSLGGPPYNLRIIKDDHDPTKKLEVVRGDIRPEGPLVQFRTVDNCILQFSQDNGETWDDAFNARPCADIAAGDAIQQGLDDGTLGGGGQQPGQGFGDPGACYEYTITLAGNNRWVSPVAIKDGDTITVSNVEGAWYDGNITGIWACPDGATYFLGACTGTGYVTSPTDPAPTVYHDRLIGSIPTAAVPFFDMYNLTYTVPDGTGESDFYLQMNDDSLADNQGSINLRIQICKSGWNSLVDFSIDDYGFLPDQSVVTQSPVPTYVSGQGWKASLQGPGYWWNLLYLDIDSTHVTHIAMNCTAQVDVEGSASANQVVGIGAYADATRVITTGAHTGPYSVVYTPANLEATRLFVWQTASPVAGTYDFYIRSVRIFGTGTKPPQLP